MVGGLSFSLRSGVSVDTAREAILGEDVSAARRSSAKLASFVW